MCKKVAQKLVLQKVELPEKPLSKLHTRKYTAPKIFYSASAVYEEEVRHRQVMNAQNTIVQVQEDLYYEE